MKCEENPCKIDFFKDSISLQGLEFIIFCANLSLNKFKLDNSTYYIGGTSDAHWPYGYAYLEKYGNWDDMNTIAAMIKGDFAKYIIEIVRNAIKNIDEKQLSIP